MSDEAGRRAERVELAVEVTVHSEHTFWSGFTSNVSTGGVFIATDRKVPLGTRVRFELALPGTQTWSIEGEVRWLRDAVFAERIPPGIGLQFIDVPADAQAAIDKFVSTKRDALFFDDED